MSLGWLPALQITGRRRSARPVTQSSSGIERSPGFPSPRVRNGSKKAKCDRIGVRFCAVSDQIAEVTEHLKIANRRIDRRLFDKGALLHRRLVVTRPERLKSPPEAPQRRRLPFGPIIPGSAAKSAPGWPIACPSKHPSTRPVPVGSLAFGMAHRDVVRAACRATTVAPISIISAASVLDRQGYRRPSMAYAPKAFDLRHGLKARLGASALLATPVCVRGTLRICRCASAPRSLKT
jgi:hypothetical protein